ncbi:MAG TPA: HlyC/CorC family transporter, partial [Ruminococcaceae bacterium]|nr:HlyC/CorC family transporter [Oscillospiraceae bacterium]
MQIFLIVILIVCSAFFSATETALNSANKIRLKNMADNGSHAAQRTLNVLAKYDKALTTILIGNNIVNIACSSIATILAINLVGEKYGSLVSTIATTVIVLIFGEVMPKSIAKDFAEPMAMIASGIISFLMVIFTPFSAFFILLKKGLSKIFHRKESVSMTEEELKVMIDEIEDEGVL